MRRLVYRGVNLIKQLLGLTEQLMSELFIDLLTAELAWFNCSLICEAMASRCVFHAASCDSTWL